MNRRKNIVAVVVVLLALAAVVLIVCLSNLSPSGSRLDAMKITILKVGKADAIMVQTGDETLVIDAGEDEDGEEVAELLTNQGIYTVDTLIITHFDKDHVGGADTLVESLEVGQVFLPDYQGSGTEYLDFLAALEQKGVQPQRLTEPLSFRLGEADVLVEPPASYEAAEMTDALDNNFSLITTVNHGENTLLFAGDAEKSRLREWLFRGSVRACDFLKIPHHGVYNTALEDLLEATLPQYAVICSSEKHPAQTQTLELLKRYNVRTLQTKDGDITVLSDGPTLEVRQDID